MTTGNHPKSVTMDRNMRTRFSDTSATACTAGFVPRHPAHRRGPQACQTGSGRDGSGGRSTGLPTIEVPISSSITQRPETATTAGSLCFQLDENIRVFQITVSVPKITENLPARRFDSLGRRYCEHACNNSYFSNAWR